MLKQIPLEEFQASYRRESFKLLSAQKIRITSLPNRLQLNKSTVGRDLQNDRGPTKIEQHDRPASSVSPKRRAGRVGSSSLPRISVYRATLLSDVFYARFFLLRAEITRSEEGPGRVRERACFDGRGSR